jgi:hypothetical protein
MAADAGAGGGALTILHLSDIHLGAYYAFRTAKSDPRLAEIGLADPAVYS